jgi:hypothetical protein
MTFPFQAEINKAEFSSVAFEKWGATFMASAEHKPISGVWEFGPSGVQGQSPLKLTKFQLIQTLILP